MKAKFLKGLEKVVATLLFLLVIAIIDVVCAIWLPHCENVMSNVFLVIWVVTIIGLGTYVLSGGTCAGIETVFRDDLPAWYTVPKFKRWLRIFCFFASLIVFTVVFSIYGGTRGWKLVPAVAVTSAQIKDTLAGELGHIMHRVGYISAIVKCAVWGYGV